MDAQAVVLILGAIGGLIGAGGAVLVAYKKATAPHSALLGLLRTLWNWLDFTEVNDRLIDRMKTGGSIASAIPDRVRVPVLRVVDPQALRAENRRASRVLYEDENPDDERPYDDDDGA